MQYAVWFVRLVFAAWMIPAGLNHFYPLFPQPLGNMPASQEMMRALLDSGLFTLVKAVELFAGLCLLAGFRVPLALVLVMPVSFNVFYWDTALQGWTSGSAKYGWAVLGCNALLCLAYWESYRSMFPLRPEAGRRLVQLGCVILGAAMLLSGLNHFVLEFVPLPTGATPLAAQMTAALVSSELINVIMAIQLVAGVLLLGGLWVPAALCVLMPLSVCTAWWALVLNQQPLWAILSLAALALNGLLMLARLDAYRPMLRRDALAIGEAAGDSYDPLFVPFRGRASGRQFALALVPLLAAFLFYIVLVPSVLGQFVWPALFVPAAALLVALLRGTGGASLRKERA